MAMSEKSRQVYDYVLSMEGKNITSEDIAAATGLTKKSVDGVVTAAFQNKGFMQRTPVNIETEEGPKAVKFISLTEEGKALNPDAE